MRVVVIGGGASGMIAAIEAARGSCEVILLEHNEKLGKKIYITGKGRCNLTNNCDKNQFLQNVISNKMFVTSAISKFSPQDTMDYFSSLGLSLKTERGNRVFPQSDKASDVTAVLHKELQRLNVAIKYNTHAYSFEIVDNTVKKVHIQTKINGLSNTITDIVLCDFVILATGGLSYTATGSDGSGHDIAKKVGHTITKCTPSLTGLVTKSDVVSLQGLSLKNVTATLFTADKRIAASEFGELLFTHEGVSGPVILTISAKATKINLEGTVLSLDLKPALTVEQLHNRLVREISSAPNKDIKNLLLTLLPEKLVKIVFDKSKLPLTLKANALTATARNTLVQLLKNLTFEIKSLCGFDQAVITSGGVDIKEVNPSTMASKIVSNLFICGELLDVDALTGGYNLQLAFSTGFVAGQSVAKMATKIQDIT